jgi:hypothetical protein
VTNPPRTLHFRPAADATTRRPNPLQALADAQRDAELVREKLRGLLTTETRHGDLQVTLSALRRCLENVQVLIEVEEGL